MSRETQEYSIKISTIAQLLGYLIGILWVSSETVRDVAYMRDQLTESVAPSLLAAKQYREEMTKRLDEFELVYDLDKKAVWVEINRLKGDIDRLERRLDKTTP